MPHSAAGSGFIQVFYFIYWGRIKDDENFQRQSYICGRVNPSLDANLVFKAPLLSAFITALSHTQ